MKYLTRLIEIVKATLIVSEIKGMSIQPFKSLCQGELIYNIEVRLLKPDIQDPSIKIIDKVIKVDIYSSVTIWELKNYVTRLLGLSPKYAMVKISPHDRILREDMHGMKIEEVHAGPDNLKKQMLSSGQVITIEKVPCAELILDAQLLTYSDKGRITGITAEFEEILNEIWDHFSDKESKTMSRSQVHDYLTLVMNSR